MTKSRSKKSMACNRPRKSWRPSKKRVVKACSGGQEKIIHFGATGYGHNYSPQARKSFRARHKCSTTKDKLTARYWACKALWTKGGSSKSCPKSCKGKSRRKSIKRKSRSRKRKSSRKSHRKSRKKSRRTSRCRYGKKKSGACKRKPGPKRSHRRRSRR